MTNWTQGPWEADQCGVSANGEDVCDCGERAQWSGDSFHPFKNAEANARLIAAAPELYEALQWMVDNDDTFQGDEPVERLGGSTWNDANAYWIDGLNRAKAALAKARGE